MEQAVIQPCLPLRVSGEKPLQACGGHVCFSWSLWAHEERDCVCWLRHSLHTGAMKHVFKSSVRYRYGAGSCMTASVRAWQFLSQGKEICGFCSCHRDPMSPESYFHNTNSFILSCIHSAACRTSNPQPFPRAILHPDRSTASSFIFQYPAFSLRSSSSCLRSSSYSHPLCPSLYLSIVMCFRRQFPIKLWPTQLAFLLLT